MDYRSEADSVSRNVGKVGGFVKNADGRSLPAETFQVMTGRTERHVPAKVLLRRCPSRKGNSTWRVSLRRRQVRGMLGLQAGKGMGKTKLLWEARSLGRLRMWFDVDSRVGTHDQCPKIFLP